MSAGDDDTHPIGLIARILRVDHGGEHGAIQIYRHQLTIARWRCPDLLPVLASTLQHEYSHRAAFHALMPARNAKLCRLMWVWGFGGAALGIITGLLGRRAVLACTAAVEEVVHHHLRDQIRFAENHDAELHATLKSIDVEEQAHLAWAHDGLRGDRGALDNLLQQVIAALTEALIWLSTRGDSCRLAKQLSENSALA